MKTKAKALLYLTLALPVLAGEAVGVYTSNSATNKVLDSKILAGELGGIGLFVTERKNPGEPLIIYSLMPGSPAERTGIKTPCFLISVNGTNVVHISFTDSRSILLGPPGTSVTLELADSAMTQTNEFTAKRGKIVKGQIIDK